jgi:hypothetical protein
MFPTLEPIEIDRLRRFGEIRTYRAADSVSRVGSPERRWMGMRIDTTPRSVNRLTNRPSMKAGTNQEDRANYLWSTR